jgi:uncharacterized protein YyaL (SSP411 family)
MCRAHIFEYSTDQIMNDTHQTRNRLGEETSPYLQQHADNPVDWYAWGPEALETARRENKPILLSIGYSACHWCHVMAHESFEDEDTARLMNERFVNIKVDREERPDLDKLYQTAHAMLTQRAGGWPLTMFLTAHDQMPFFGGTYFPKEARYGLPAFRELLQRVADFHQQHGDEIERQNASLQSALGEVYAQRETGMPLNSAALDQARAELAQAFDSHDGGFGAAPKFPHPASIERLLRHWALTCDGGGADDHARHMALFTLEKMALGGIYDQLGGGFCRYSVDDQWMIPHFEKMLYDNGPLLALSAPAAGAAGEPLFERIARETADWVMREMQSPEGGYYASLDADSEGEEGRYYVWTPDEARELLPPDAYETLARRFGLDHPPNFEGRWHLHVFKDLETLAAKTGRPVKETEVLLDTARATLLAARERRVRPGRDDKILTSWNALMIRGMAIAARHLGLNRCTESADRALDFIRATMWRDGRLLATYKGGRAHLAAYLDDYAFLIDAILELLQVRWRTDELLFARELAEVLLAHFEDKEHGGFFFTADDHETLIQRPRALADEAMPAGYAIAVQALSRLGHLLGETRYLEAAERALRAAAYAMEQAPSAHCALLTAFEEHLHYPQVAILRGEGEDLDRWAQACIRPYAPRRLCFALPAQADDLPPALADKPVEEQTVAYLCTGMTCSAPIRAAAELEAALEGTT